MNIKISVILTIYNTAKYLPECLDSILQQSMTEFELLCINDASTDGSFEILNRYAAQDKRLQLYTMPDNKGASHCRNFGLTKAQGEYVIFLDSDDYFKLTMLQELYEQAERDKADIVICNSVKHDDVLHENLYMKDSLRIDYLHKTHGFHYTNCAEYIFNFCKGWAWDKLYRKSFIEEHELQFPILSNTEDAVFVYQSLILANRISVLDSILVVHRIRRNDSISNRHDNNISDFVTAMEMVKDFLKEQGVFEQVAKSYGNLAVNLGIWYLNTLRVRQNQEALYQILHAELFPALMRECGMTAKELFYEKSDYKLFQQIIKQPYSEKQFQKVKQQYQIMRGLKSLKENGLFYWIKRGLHH